MLLIGNLLFSIFKLLACRIRAKHHTQCSFAYNSQSQSHYMALSVVRASECIYKHPKKEEPPNSVVAIFSPDVEKNAMVFYYFCTIYIVKAICCKVQASCKLKFDPCQCSCQVALCHTFPLFPGALRAQFPFLLSKYRSTYRRLEWVTPLAETSHG